MQTKVFHQWVKQVWFTSPDNPINHLPPVPILPGHHQAGKSSISNKPSSAVAKKPPPRPAPKTSIVSGGQLLNMSATSAANASNKLPKK